MGLRVVGLNGFDVRGWSVARLIRRLSVMVSLCDRHLSCGGLQSTESQQVVSGADQMRVQLNPGDAPEARASQAAVALHPTEDLLDPLALFLADPVARMPSRARIQSRRAAVLDLRNVWTNASAAQELHKIFRAVALVRTEAVRQESLAALAFEHRRRRSGLALAHQTTLHAPRLALSHAEIVLQRVLQQAARQRIASAVWLRG